MFHVIYATRVPDDTDLDGEASGGGRCIETVASAREAIATIHDHAGYARRHWGPGEFVVTDTQGLPVDYLALATDEYLAENGAAELCLN